MKNNWLLVVLLFSTRSSLLAEVIDPYKLLKEVDQTYRAQSSFAKIEMIVENPDWSRKLTMKAWSLGDEFTLIRILSPIKDKGVSTLRRKLEMWNYFPKINREIKVPPSMMMGSWMGSDFTNDDLVKQADLADQYLVSMKTTDSKYLLTLIPKKNTVTVWGRIEYSIAKGTKLPIEQTYFDEKGEKIRRLLFSDNQLYSGKLLPRKMEMISFSKPGNKTTVIYQDLTLNLDIKQSFFSLHNLKKAK